MRDLHSIRADDGMPRRKQGRSLLPEGLENLMEVLRAHKPELIDLLKSRGGRVAAFPHCPRCASYALYREVNIGAYECQTCGLQNIEEQIARRLI